LARCPGEPCAPGYLFVTESPERWHGTLQDAFNRRGLDSIVALYEPGGVLARVDGPETARRQPDGRWLFVIDNPSVPQD
jgi:hypothetical protein